MPKVIDKEELEKELAQGLAKLQDFLDKDCKTLKEEVKAVKGSMEEFKKIDVEGALKEIEKLKATHEKLIKDIRTDPRNPGFVPGMEDAHKRFSVCRVLAASKDGWERAGAQFEKECMDAWQQKLKAAGAIGDDKLGGFFMPDQVIPEVITAIFARSVFFNLASDGQTRVSVLNGLVGGNVRIPKVTGGMVAYWVGEQEQPAESLDTVGDVSLNPKKLMMLVKLTDSMRRFGGFGFESILRNDMINAAAEKVDWTVAYGNGSDNMPLGIINTNGIKIFSNESKKYGVLGTDSLTDTGIFQATWAGAALTWDTIDLMNLALEEDKIRRGPSDVTISSPRAFSYLRRLKVDHYASQTTNQSYLLGVPVLSDTKLADIIGAFDKTPQIDSDLDPGASVGAPPASASGNCTDVFKGNLAEIVVGRWSGLEVETDNGMGPGFRSDHSYTKLRMYMDIGCRQPRAVIVCPDAIVR